ncbi:MAG: hypothetical protein AAGC96_10330 [Pseudomonadota bacterium]
MTASTIGQQQAQRMVRSGESGEGARNVLRCALERSAAIRLEFEEFTGPTRFSDHRADQIVEDTRRTLGHADLNVREALKQIEACIFKSAP